MKKKFSLSKLLVIIGLIVGIITLLLPLGTAASNSVTILNTTITTSWSSAYSFIFGGQCTTAISGGTSAGSTTAALEGPAPVALIGWIALALGVIVTALALIFGWKKGRLCGWIALVGGALIALGGIMFCSTLTNLPVALDKDIIAEDAAKLMEGWTLGFGFLGSGIVGLISGVAIAVGGLFRGLFKR